MKIRNLFLPSVALGAAFLMMTPKESTGFSLLGHSLSTSQADFRVFNNFTDTAANNNTVGTTQYPGYTGSVMAIWKGAAEWSSGPHGDGNGDPSQAVIGSGGSSFDPIFNGEANGVGSIGNNILSELNQNGGGVLAFMQGGSTGWWIRFHSNHTWADGPGNIPFNQFDLQGTTCHEYGHSIGLNHSTAGGQPTMSAFSNGTGYVDRSLSADDIAGIKAIYGVANSSGTKPVISQVINLGGQVKIIGTNFTLNNNQVWFTRLTPGTTGGTGGNPIKVTGVSSTNGNTEIVVNIPGTAGPGDIMVKRNSAGQESTSACFPFDPFSVPPPAPMVTNVSPAQVSPIQPGALSSVVLTGSGLSAATNLLVNGKEPGEAGVTLSGAWSVDSDNQISITMPLTGSAGVVDITFDTPGGPGTAQVEIVPPSTPSLVAANSNLVQAVGLSIAGSAEFADVMFLDYSGVNGATTIPGLFELEIGGGNLNNVFKLKKWTMGAKLWRRFDSGPVTGLPIGIKVYFEGVVLEAANGFNFPWNSTNKVTITIIA